MKKPTDTETLRRLWNGLAETVAELPEKDILSETREAGRDPDEVAARMRRSVLAAVKTFRQEKLRNARSTYERENARLRSRSSALPATAEERRNLLEASLQRRPDLRDALTLAARDLSGVPDTDVESLLRQLDDLGGLSDSKPSGKA
jgi:alkanesulfonate monooxygenase SsuD/methylene tetrahydromethanopterin reductase-like flavin-dependent oxidoreductase (luciferase family)